MMARAAKAFPSHSPPASLQGLCSSSSSTIAACSPSHFAHIVDWLVPQKSPPRPGFYAALIRRCRNSNSLTLGRRIHLHLHLFSNPPHHYLCNLLLEMYGKCLSLPDARSVFDHLPYRNVFSWTLIMSSYAQHGLPREAFELFCQMQQDAVPPNDFTFSIILGTCDTPADIAVGQVIYRSAVNCGFEADLIVGTALVNMYSKCGTVQDARRVFDKLHLKNVISWTTVIAAYAQHGHGQEALELFTQMQQEGVEPNKFTLSTILTACLSLSNLQLGKHIHAMAFDGDIIVETALLNMYSKCGSLTDAQEVFDRMQQRNIVAWNAIIGAYAQFGHSNIALKLFRQMQEEYVTPDDATFISLFSACSHGGLVDEGTRFFVFMIEIYKIKPRVEHYTIMIDLFGRAGRLEEAENIISRMPLQGDAAVWLAMLSACKAHGDAHRGKLVAEHIVQLDSENAAPYLMLLHMYAADTASDCIRIEEDDQMFVQLSS